MKRTAPGREPRSVPPGARGTGGLHVGLADPGPAREAWAAWIKHPDGDGPERLRMLAAHIEQAWPTLSDAATALRAAAEGELRAREDRWAPVAAQVAAWCKQASTAETAAQAVPALQAAITWLKNATDDIRNARLEASETALARSGRSCARKATSTWARSACRAVATAGRWT